MARLMVQFYPEEKVNVVNLIRESELTFTETQGYDRDC